MGVYVGASSARTVNGIDAMVFGKLAVVETVKPKEPVVAPVDVIVTVPVLCPLESVTIVADSETPENAALLIVIVNNSEPRAVTGVAEKNSVAPCNAKTELVLMDRDKIGESVKVAVMVDGVV
jgi:hypothetical protein